MKIVWASHTSSDADSGLSKHSKTGILSGKHNLIKEVMSESSAGVIGPYFASCIVVACLSVYLMSF